METYYDAEKVKAIGKPVWSGNKQPRIPNGHRLLAVMDRLIHKACPDVTNPDEFAHFYENYRQGYWVKMSLFLVPESQLAECVQ